MHDYDYDVACRFALTTPPPHLAPRPTAASLRSAHQIIYQYISESIQDILGYGPFDLLGKSAWIIFHPEEIGFIHENHE